MIFGRILKDSELKKAYVSKMFNANRQDFRLVMAVAIVYLVGYTVYDRTRTQHYEDVLVLRCAQILLVSFGLIVTYSKRLSSAWLDRIALFVTYGLIFLAFLLGHYGGLPPYQLSNTIFIFFLTNNALMSYGLLSKCFQTLFTVITYVLYSLWLSPEGVFHSSQIAMVVTMATFSYVIAIVFERYKQLNFLSLFELESSRAKIEELSELKTKFLAILSHDLVSPLLTLKGILELAQMGKMSSEESASYLKRVEINLSSSIELAKNMVGWSRSKLGNELASEKCIEVVGVINEVIDSMREVAHRKNVRIEFNKRELISALIDVELIKLAVRNIISNAIKFSYPDTTILISVEVTENTMEVSVTDTGVGMSHDDLSKLFTLKKSSSKGTQNESGSGIGLFVVKEFIDLAGGSISVKSEIKRGSTFTVTLPLKNC